MTDRYVEIVDGEVYPSGDALKFIMDFDLTRRPVKELVDFLEKVWWCPSFGFKVEPGEDVLGKECVKLRLSTGGWSGNEELMDALEKNKYFYLLYWESSVRGGHYTFEIPLDAWNTKTGGVGEIQC